MTPEELRKGLDQYKKETNKTDEDLVYQTLNMFIAGVFDRQKMLSVMYVLDAHFTFDFEKMTDEELKECLKTKYKKFLNRR